jgi:hypothetical protein
MSTTVSGEPPALSGRLRLANQGGQARPARRKRRLLRAICVVLLFSPYLLLPLMPVVAITLWILGIG